MIQLGRQCSRHPTNRVNTLKHWQSYTGTANNPGVTKNLTADRESKWEAQEKVVLWFRYPLSDDRGSYTIYIR
jgi:hypothetical protein